MANMTPEMKIYLDVWLTHKKERKESYRPTGLGMIKRQAVKWGEKRFMEAVEFSVRNNYSGLFEPPDNSTTNEVKASLKDYMNDN